MDLLSIAAQIFQSSISGQQGASNVNSSMITKGLGALLGGADGKIDLSDVLALFQNQGMGSLVSSWLGSGSNQSVGVEQLLQSFGQDKIGKFASSLNISNETALSGLTNAIPELIDKASPNGNVDQASSLLVGLAKSFLRG